MSEKNIMIVDTVEALEKRIEEVREAQRIFFNLFTGAGR